MSRTEQPKCMKKNFPLNGKNIMEQNPKLRFREEKQASERRE